MKKMERLKALEEELNAIPSTTRPARPHLLEGLPLTIRCFWVTPTNMLTICACVDKGRWKTACHYKEKFLSLPKALQLAKAAALSD